ncbi:hypothetical protein JCM8547_006673 [Rhodosporidiobolus lusitaniae]
MSTDAGFPTPGQLVDKVPLIKNPGFWVPKPVELPPDIHPLPDDVHAYFVYPHTLEQHVLSTLPAQLQAAQQAHEQRLHLLNSYAESKERARKARLNQVAPGWDEGGKALEPVRRKDTVAPLPAAASSSSTAAKAEESLLGEEDAGEKAPETPTNANFLGRPEVGSPDPMGQGTMDKMQRDLVLDVFEGLERLDTSFVGGGGGKASGGGTEVDDLI